jgi:hypothetical protein
LDQVVRIPSVVIVEDDASLPGVLAFALETDGLAAHA